MADDKKKDFWDKLQISASFLSTFLLGVAGVWFTHVYNQGQLAQAKIQQAAQAKLDSLRYQTEIRQAEIQVQLQQVQLQTAQVQAMTQLVPYLANKDAATQKVAYSILQSIDSSPVLPNQGAATASTTAPPRTMGTAPRTVYGTLLEQIRDKSNIAVDPSQSFASRITAYNDLIKIAHDKTNSKQVLDSAASAVEQVRKSPNSPLLGIGFTVDGFRKYLDTLKLGSWQPSFIVLHHTAEPNLQQYPDGFTEPSIVNLIKFFTDEQHWNGAMHLIVDDHKIWVLNPLTKPGVHSPSWNKVSLGVSMLGDYDRESFDTGRGKTVRDNTVAALALLEKKFGIPADSVKLHSQDPRSMHKSCPGKNVDKASIIADTRKLART